MPWSVERKGSVMRVSITVPVLNEWEALLDKVMASLDPSPLAIYVPAIIQGASSTDADLLRLFCTVVGSLGIPILPPG
jgi:hypothetical protein